MKLLGPAALMPRPCCSTSQAIALSLALDEERRRLAALAAKGGAAGAAASGAAAGSAAAGRAASASAGSGAGAGAGAAPAAGGAAAAGAASSAGAKAQGEVSNACRTADRSVAALLSYLGGFTPPYSCAVDALAPTLWRCTTRAITPFAAHHPPPVAVFLPAPGLSRHRQGRPLPQPTQGPHPRGARRCTPALHARPRAARRRP